MTTPPSDTPPPSPEPADAAPAAAPSPDPKAERRQRFRRKLELIWLSVLLVLAILVGVNWIATRQHKRWDLTAARQFSISDQTRSSRILLLI